jgi:hypothetical protein
MATNEAVSLDPREFSNVLNGLKTLDKSANRDMRLVSEQIADQIMVPAIRRTISAYAPSYADKLNRSIRTKQDRIPSVRIGASGRGSGSYSGGASTNMLRFGTIKGQYTARSGRTQFWADGNTPGWTQAADNDYAEPAFAAWVKEAEKIVNNWNRGSDY